mgnify:CR=1 FL=1
MNSLNIGEFLNLKIEPFFLRMRKLFQLLGFSISKINSSWKKREKSFQFTTFISKSEKNLLGIRIFNKKNQNEFQLNEGRKVRIQDKVKKKRSAYDLKGQP